MTDCAEEDSKDARSNSLSLRSGCVDASRRRCLSTPITKSEVIGCYYIDPRQHHDFSVVFWSRTCYYIGVSVQTFFKYYLEDVVGIEDAEAAIVKTAIIGQMCAAVTAIPTGQLSDYWGAERKTFIYIACAMLGVGNILNCFVRNEQDVYIVAGFLGCANGAYLSMDAALALDHLPSGDEAARFMGIWGIGCFLGSAVGPVLGGPVLAVFGHDSAKPQAYTYHGYACLLMLAGVAFAMSGVLLRAVGDKAAVSDKAEPTWCVWLRRHFRRIQSGPQDAATAVKASAASMPKGSSQKFYDKLQATNWLNV